MLRILMVFLIGLPLALAQNKIYKTVDEHGNEIYTDTPPASETDVEEVDVNPVNTVAPPPAIPKLKPSGDPEPTKATPPQITITSPGHDTTIPMGPGNFTVSASVEPAPQPGQMLQLQMDGEVQGPPQTAASWALSNVFRGAHTLVVNLLDGEGNVVSSSEPVTVYVHRPSVLFRNR